MTTHYFNWVQNTIDLLPALKREAFSLILRKQPAEQKTMLGSMCRSMTCGALRQHRELHHQTGIDAPRLGYE